MKQGFEFEGPMKYVGQGEFAVAEDPSAILTTLLGSCVSVCFHDPVAKVGGMNHILLPDNYDQSGINGIAIHGMEMLVNPILRLGANKTRMVAKVFGGARFSGVMGKIGEQNVRFVMNYLEKEDIICAAKSVGGTRARRIMFWPGTGKAKQKFVNDTPIEVTKPKTCENGLELF